MQTALLLARLLLSGVFGIAGLAKLADRAGSRQALLDFGVPRKLARLLGVLLPVAELVVAVALLPVSTAWLGAFGAVSFLLLFCFGIALNLARGRTPDCHCFGQISSSPIGWSTLSRNLLLALGGGFVIWQGRDDPGLSALSWFVELTTAQHTLFVIGMLGLAILAAEGWLLLQMLRQQGRILLRLDKLESSLAGAKLTPDLIEPHPHSTAGLRVGTTAPGFRLNGLRGETMTLEALLAARKPVLLVFIHPSCGPCHALMPDISRWQREHVSELTIALISDGTVEDNIAKCDENGLTQVLLQTGREIAESYQAYGTPSAVLVSPNGSIGSSLVSGVDDIRILLKQAVRGARSQSVALPDAPQSNHNGRGNGANKSLLSVGAGQSVSSLDLKDLEGKPVSLTAYLRGKTLLLFWNPGCGFCQQMLAELKEWEANASSEAPQLLVVSSGTVEENRAMNLRSTVLLDQNFQAGSAFGATGTPTALLLDDNGIVISDAAVGTQAVLALAGVRH